MPSALVEGLVGGKRQDSVRSNGDDSFEFAGHEGKAIIGMAQQEQRRVESGRQVRDAKE